MKLYLFSLVLIMIGLILNIFNYDYFMVNLSFVWYIASILIIYASFKYCFKYKFIQLNIRKIIEAIKSKSNNNISPISSLCISLAAKIGVGSLSGVALAIYFGGIGTIFWISIISLIVSINTYQECILGIKYRKKNGNSYVGGPGYYIDKCLGNRRLGFIYSILIIICYSGLFLSIQSNTIVNALGYFDVNSIYIVIILVISVMFIIFRGVKGIVLVNNKLVPVMLIFYLLLGLYVLFDNIKIIPDIFINVLCDAFSLRSIIPCFLVGIQRGIFITESSIGTSAMSASVCDNDASKQGLLEVLGIHITTFIVCLTTFLLIVTSDYQMINFGDINGIEIVMYAFHYHFGSVGRIFLTLVTIMFAFSTIISSYFFGENNIKIYNSRRWVINLFKILFLMVIIISCYIKPTLIWNMTDYLVAILVIINVISMVRITNRD